MVDTNAFNRSMQAALKGPEIKQVKIEKHEFNVKPIKLTQLAGGMVDLVGQISHHLRWRDDDQVHYKVTFRPGDDVNFFDVDLNIDASIMNESGRLLWDEVLKPLIKEWLENEASDLGKQDAALTRQAEQQTFERSKALLNGTWQGEANFLIANIVSRAAMSQVRTMARRRPSSGRAATPGTMRGRTHTTPTSTDVTARDHRS